MGGETLLHKFLCQCQLRACKQNLWKKPAIVYVQAHEHLLLRLLCVGNLGMHNAFAHAVCVVVSMHQHEHGVV
jgi:hypothetical protein